MFKNIYFDYKTNKIHLWEIDEDGSTTKIEEDVSHEYYVLNSAGKYKDHFGRNFSRAVASSKKEMQLVAQSTTTAETDLDVAFKYLHHRYYKKNIKPDRSKFNIANIDIEISSENEFPFPEFAKYPINLISVHSSFTDEVYTFGNQEYTGNSQTVKNYCYCKSEEELLVKFVKWFRKQKFDIITGWNIKGFDIPYIVNRIINLGKNNSDFANMELELLLSPINKMIHKRDGIEKSIPGLSIIDYMPLYKNFTFTELDSYSLQNVCMNEIKEGKLDFDGQINTIWKTDWNTFVEYNIQDVLLVNKLDKKKKFINLAIYFCYEALIPLEKFEATVATIEGVIWKKLHEQDKVMLDRQEHSDWWHDEKMFIVKQDDGSNYYQNCKADEGIYDFEDHFVKGGHVEAYPGYYKDVMSFDVASEYPHMMMMYNISPETKITKPSLEQIESENLIKSQINGVYYRRNEDAILPCLVREFFNDRKKFKKLMFAAGKAGNKDLESDYDSQQHVRKIFINSVYGACANEGFHYFDADNARSITRGGRVLIRHLGETIVEFSKTKRFYNDMNKLFNKKVIHSDKSLVSLALLDTDSNYLCLSSIRELYAEDITKSEFFVIIEPYIQEFFGKILDIKAKNENVPQVIVFKREAIITDQIVFAKKKYASLLLSKEDEVYDPPKFKATGIEIQQSSTPKYCKKVLKDTIIDVFANNSKSKSMELIKKIKKEFFSSDYNEICASTGVNGIDKYTEASKIDIDKLIFIPALHTTMQARAAIVHNIIIKKNQFPYMEILNGSKIKFIRVKTNNSLKTNVIGWVGNYPKEFSGIFDVDYEDHFFKEYLAPIQRLWDVLGWGSIDFKDNKMKSLLD